MMTAHIPFEIKEIMECFDTKDKTEIEYIMKLHLIEYCKKESMYLDILKEYDEKIRRIPKVLGKFASTINSDNILSNFEQLKRKYHETFLDFFYKYKVYERVPWETVKQICANSICKFKIFEYQAIILHYDNELMDLIETENSIIEMLIRNEFQASTHGEKSLYYPSGLSPEKKEQLVQEYIKSNDVNANYLKLIFNSRGTEKFKISDKTRLMAKKKYVESFKEVEKRSNTVKCGCEIFFKSIPNYESIEKYDGEMCHLTYSEEWLKENLDFPTLLNNFIYLFGFCDRQFRMNFVSLSKDSSVIEAILGFWGKKDYFTNFGFKMKNMIHSLQMQAYCYELKKYNIDLQDIFKWFFEEYLNNEFNAGGFVYIVPSKGTTYLEKCILLSCQIDSILKQFDMFSLNGCIERELFELSSNHIDFKNVKGIVDGKYAYFESADIKKEGYLIFSDQSHLSFTDKKEFNYSDLYSLLHNENVKLSDFHDYQIADIEWLIKKNSIFNNEDGFLKLNEDKITVLKNLYYYDVVSCSYIGKYKHALDELVACGDVVIESTLFSRKEQEYLNFMLNNSKYENGPALRNNYVHGSYSLNLKKHEGDYYELLKIMVMIIIKINEEFCLKNPEF